MITSRAITTLGYTSRNWSQIVWADTLNLFVAVAANGSATGTNTMTSPDGLTWTGNVGVIGRAWSGLAWSSELGLLVAVSTQGSVMTSTDGITWTLQTITPVGIWGKVAWSPRLGLFVAVGGDVDNDVIMTSPDGVTWTARTSPPAITGWADVAWSEHLKLFAIVKFYEGNPIIAVSPDGITWTPQVAPIAPTTFGRIVYGGPGNGSFLAHAADGSVITSEKGTDWIMQESPGVAAFGSLAWSDYLQVFVAGPQLPETAFLASHDGSMFEQVHDVTTAGTFNATAWSPTLRRFATVGSFSVIATVELV